MQFGAMMRFHHIRLFLTLQLIANQQGVVIVYLVRQFRHYLLSRAAACHSISWPRVMEEIGIADNLPAFPRLGFQV